MKFLIKQTFVLILVVFVQVGYSQEPKKTQNTESLKTEALKLYKLKKYDEALKLVQEIAQIKAKEFGLQHLETGKALTDVATIQIADGRMKDGEKTMRQAVAIYELQPNLSKEEKLDLAEMFEILGFVRYKDDKPLEAIKEYRRALELKEKYTGAQSLETSKTLWQIANMFLAASDYQNSYEYYEKVVRIRSNNMNWLGYDEVRDALRRYECTANKSGNAESASSLISITQDKIDKYFKQTVLDEGIVNGKAIKLVRPPYPDRAKAIRLTGSVEVQVTINETGTVIFACARSGHPLLYQNSEEAALSSKFSPTLVNGRAVKITGIIVYNFVR